MAKTIQAKVGTGPSGRYDVKYKRSFPEKGETIEVRPVNWDRERWDPNQDRNGWSKVRVTEIKEHQKFLNDKLYYLSK